MSKLKNGPYIPAIRWPIPKNNRGGEFSNLEEILAHMEGEATGHWLIGSNGMWHGGIHITDATTPWCALSGQALNEAKDYPVPYQGEQALRCMADGEVVAYRVNRDYLSMPWYWGDLQYSGSFVLVRHRIQPGKTAESGLTFYTLYMHLAPWLAYQAQDSTAFKVADGEHLKAYVDTTRQWAAAVLPPGTRVTWDKAASADTLTGNNERQYAHVTLAEPVRGSMSLKTGDRVWILCDRGNLVPASDNATQPSWWSPFLPPSREALQFDTVVCPTPYPIKAGDPVGHLGWFQLPDDAGYKKRYQGHIECLTNEALPHFLNNPEGVGRDKPAFARCPKDIPVYLKSFFDGDIQPGRVKTSSETIIPLSGKVLTDAAGKRYWPEGTSNGLLAESDLQLLSRYDLAGRGFETTQCSPARFDHLDGKTQPKGLVKTIFERLFTAASNSGEHYDKLMAHNYRMLLNKINASKAEAYSPEEYRRAVHYRPLRSYLYHLCVKHPGEWYYPPEDALWTAYLSSIKKELPHWHTYSIRFLTDTRWMHRVAEMVENPWHMHPLVFLDAIAEKRRKNVNRPKNVQDFLDMASEAAMSAASKWGIPASVLLAQSALESGWGSYVKNNAYFGIKGKSPSGNSVSFGTTEVINGKVIHINDTFRAYANYAESADDYGRFLNSNKRYKPAFLYTKQPNKFITEVANAGYATDPDYASKLIHLMKRYDLYEFD